MSWPVALSIAATLLISLLLLIDPRPSLENYFPNKTPKHNSINSSASIPSPSASNNSAAPSVAIEDDSDDFATSETDDFNAAAEDFSFSPTPPPTADHNLPQIAGTSGPELYLVSRVIDGDTLRLSSGDTVRLIGINTPESVHPREEVACFGKEAAAYSQQLLTGQYVSLESDITDRDRYGRLLRYVYLHNQFVNEQLVAEGYAHSYPYPPDIKYQSRLDAAEAAAQAAGRGLWNACQSSSPTVKTHSPPPNPDCAIKGNISSTNEKIYHQPNCPYYNRTSIDTTRGERYFCTPEEAENAGWRRASNCP